MSFARARALAIVGVLAVAAIVLVVGAISRDRQSGTNYAAGGCGPDKTTISTRLPSPAAIKINLYNGSGERTKDQKIVNAVPNLAGQVAEEFRNRDFKVDKVEEHPQKFDQVARLSFGPKAFAASYVVRAFFLNEAEPGGFDLKRTDDVVGVTLGSGFKKLASRTEVGQEWAALGKPSPPPGTCDSGN